MREQLKESFAPKPSRIFRSNPTEIRVNEPKKQ